MKESCKYTMLIPGLMSLVLLVWPVNKAAGDILGFSLSLGLEAGLHYKQDSRFEGAVGSYTAQNLELGLEIGGFLWLLGHGTFQGQSGTYNSQGIVYRERYNQNWGGSLGLGWSFLLDSTVAPAGERPQLDLFLTAGWEANWARYPNLDLSFQGDAWVFAIRTVWYPWGTSGAAFQLRLPFRIYSDPDLQSHYSFGLGLDLGKVL